MSITFSLIAMCLLGLTHFINGLVSEHYPPIRISLYTHIGGCVIGLGCALALSNWHIEAILWGTLAGTGSALGALLLYRGLSIAPFGIVVPVSAVSMVMISLGLSLIFLGEQLNIWIWTGVVIALPAIWLTAGGKAFRNVLGQKKTGAGLILGIGAGIGFALQLHFLGQVPDQAAFFGIALCMLSGGICLLPFCSRKSPNRKRYAFFATTAGGISALGLTLYALSREGQLAIVSIMIVSMYPLIPVIFGSLMRKEAISNTSKIGIGLSIVATMLIVAGTH